MSTAPESAPQPGFLVSGGEMGRRIREFDWGGTSLGTSAEWPQSLRSALSICLGCGFPIAIYWGRDLALLYNDAWSPIPAAKHPWALGHPARKVWPEIWNDIEPLFEQVLATGEPVRRSDQLLPMHRRGFTEECYFDFTFSPIRDEAGSVGGIFNAAIETTSRVLAERRAQLLRELAASVGDAPTLHAVAQQAAAAFEDNRHDLPFTLIYVAGAEDGVMTLVSASGLSADALALMPTAIHHDDPTAPLPFAAARELPEGQGLLIDQEALAFLGPALPPGPWPEPVQHAVVQALPRAGGGEVAGFLVSGLSPRLAWNSDYQALVTQAARTIATALDRSRAYVAERERAEKLAEIDRAKTAFFSNVSHEFRTPLTLLLGPLEEIVGRSAGGLGENDRELAVVAHRNALRLLKLVNTLLDFSRLEAGRVQGHFELTDLGPYTAELASSFRSAMEKAGLRLTVAAPALAPAYVDREMWEKIVLNLLSNAFKFTLQGEVIVTLRETDGGAELEVRDTGAGISAEAQARLFERFFRVQGVQARTHEGSGIGLALVHELVKLHGGTVRVESEPGQGSAFIVTLPRGTAPVRHAAPGTEAVPELKFAAAAPFVAEAARWLPEGPLSVPGIHITGQERPRVLLADDNADMREYIIRLLSPHMDVTVVADGESALQAIPRVRPHLVLSDAMMPRLDGFGLLRALREDPATRTLPVILLSARAGEEARVEGVQHGADDYLVKPFSARELIARVTTHLQLGRLRAEAAEELRRSEERYRAFIANSSEGIWRLEFDPPLDITLPVEEQVEHAYRDSRMAECNAVMARMYGLESEADLLGCSLDAMLPSTDPAAREFLSAIIRAGYRVTDVESTERDAKGNPVYFSNTMVGVVEDGLLKRIWGTQRDISARRRAQAALRESEERYRLLFDRSPLPTFVVDCETLRFRAVNAAAVSLYGYSLEEFTALTLLDIRPKEDVAVARQLIARTKAGSDVMDLRKEMGLPDIHRHETKDGVVLFVEPRTLEITFLGRRCWLATVTDVTVRRLSDDHMKWLAAFPEHNPNPVIEVDLNTGSIFYANSYTFQRYPDLRTAGLGHPLLAGLESTARLLVESSTEIVRREVCAEGTWFMQTMCYLADCNHVRLYFTDISALKRAEAQLRENEETLRAARDQAEQASRSKDNFLAMLSHELRTPLTPVLMSVAVLEHDLDLRTDVREELAMMRRNIELETKLIDDLLDLNRITTGKLALEIETVDLNEAVRHVCGICGPQLRERGIRLETALDPSICTVGADPARLQQVLWNVLKNAIKFTPDQGTIRVSTRQLQGSQCEVRVQDSGVGIPAEMLPRIFDAFEQGDASITRRFGGLGLGLAICKALMELHHGTIHAESAGSGLGSTFSIQIPCRTMTATARIRLKAPTEKTMAQFRLLVVEDHPDTLRTLTKLLTRAGFTVFTASSVEAAESVAKEESFDMLISDLGLPDGDGHEVMRRVRALHCHIPGIAMSGYGTDEDMRRSREAGFSEHLTKPVEFATLQRAINRVAAKILGGDIPPAARAARS